MSEQHAREWFESLGFVVEPGANHVHAGRNPDFLCVGRVTAWVEVKDLDEPEPLAELGNAWVHIRERTRGIPGSGHARVAVAAPLDQQVARRGIHLLRQSMHDHMENGVDALLVSVPREPDYSRRESFDYTTAFGDERRRVRLSSYGAAEGRMGYTMLFEPANPFEAVALFSAPDAPVPLHTVADGGSCQLAFEVFPDERPFRLSGCGRIDGAWQSTLRRQVRRVVSSANEQLRNARALVSPHPSVCMVYVPFGGDRVSLLSALFGDVVVPVNAHGQAGPAQYGRNGVLAPNRNRSVSAVVFWFGARDPLIAHNPWCHDSIPVGVLAGDEYVPD